MGTGYIWSVSYTRSGSNGKCETLKMEIQIAIYVETKNVLVYYAETDTHEITKTLVR